MGIVLAIIGIIIIFILGSAVLKANARMHHADKLRANRAVEEGSGGVPSWAGSNTKNEMFVHGIQKLAMHHGVPQLFLTATLSDTGTFKSLVHYAAAMEQEGASFAEQQAAVSEQLVGMWKQRGQEEISDASTHYDDDDGKTGPPSWVNNNDSQREFAAGVQVMAAPDGLGPEALTAMFSLQQPVDRAIEIAGAVERQGGTFKDQQAAVKNFMVIWWNDLSPDLQETFSQSFENRG